nr:hypothetical protein [Tanacetum cinerariifolium]
MTQLGFCCENVCARVNQVYDEGHEQLIDEMPNGETYESTNGARDDVLCSPTTTIRQFFIEGPSTVFCVAERI